MNLSHLFARPRYLGLLVAVACLPLLVGCGGESLQTARGKVVYGDGTPVQGGSITFNNAEKRLSATSDIAADGTFALKFGNSSGAPAGEYTVVVTGSSDVYGAPPTVDNIYGDPSKTPLTQTIKPGSNTDLEVKVERPKKK